MSNYPPGTSAGDPRAPWNAADHSHDHEWYPAEKENPIFEDGAAIFHDYCEYSEGRYGDGWSCEETRSMRFDIERVVISREGEPDVTYLASTEDSADDWSYVHSVFERAIELVECGTEDDLHIRQIDPANKYGNGYVELTVGKYTVIYSQ